MVERLKQDAISEAPAYSWEEPARASTARNPDRATDRGAASAREPEGLAFGTDPARRWPAGAALAFAVAASGVLWIAIALGVKALAGG